MRVFRVLDTFSLFIKVEDMYGSGAMVDFRAGILMVFFQSILILQVELLKPVR